MTERTRVTRVPEATQRFYLNLSDGQDWEEGYLRCTPTEAKELEEALSARMLALGYPDQDLDVFVQSDPDELDYEFNPDVTTMAKEICQNAGFMDQDGIE